MLARSSPLRSAFKSRSYATLNVNNAAGVKVAAIDNAQSTVAVSIVVKAGSRYQSQPGVAHALKNFAFKATANSSALRTVRETELYGGVLSSGLSRENLYLNAEFLRGDEDYFVNLLGSVLSSTKFHPHEFNELVLPTLQADTLGAIGTPSTLAMDLAHQSAFRRGLGNSLYASPHSPLSVQDVKSYASQAFAKGNIAVFGTGISTDALSEAVNKSFRGAAGAASGSPLTSPTSKYYGGEQRVPLDLHSSGQPTMIIAFGTTSTSPELEIIPHLLGGESALKWVPGTTPLGLASAKVPGSKISSFNIAYSDASLVGVQITAPTSEGVKALAQEVANIVKGLGEVSEEELKKAVASAKFKAASSLDSKDGLLAAYGSQLVSGAEVKSLEQIHSAFSGVSAKSLAKTAGDLFKSKPTVVSVGDLAVLPYADELGL